MTVLKKTCRTAGKMASYEKLFFIINSLDIFVLINTHLDIHESRFNFIAFNYIFAKRLATQNSRGYDYPMGLLRKFYLAELQIIS